MISVFLEQDLVKKEADAKEILRTARQNEACIGGRIFTSGRGRQQKFVVQRYFRDDGGTPPTGMARLKIPSHTAAELGLAA